MNDVPVRDGATVALLRDVTDGFEVFMLKRSSAAVFSPSAHVFPGGAVGEGDHAPIELDGGAIGHPFEEAGMLLAHGPDGTMVQFDDPEIAERFALHRKAIHASESSIGDVCAQEGLTLAIDRLVLFGHWITPRGAPRRFDTRFFAARAPERQTASSRRARQSLGIRWVDIADLNSSALS